MERFVRMGEAIRRELGARAGDPRLLPPLAARVLEEHEPFRHIGPYETLEWILSARSLPPQRGVGNPFGRPSVQVYDGGEFYIEVLHWLDGTTEIHQHSFAGAFQVLAGSSVHSLYRFEESERHGDDLRLGRVEAEAVEHLTRGDVRTIVPGSAMIHSLFHLDRPSVTVVIRTSTLKSEEAQFSYWKPAMAVNLSGVPDRVQRQLHAMDGLARLGRPNARSALAGCLRGADTFGFVVLALSAPRWLPAGETLADFLREVRPHQPELIDRIAAVAAERSRQDGIVRLRNKLHLAQHRLFLALLLNCDTAEEIVSLTSAAHPGERPADAILRWIDEIRDLLPEADRARTLFDLFSDDTLRDVLKWALSARGRTADVCTMSDALRGTLLAPLFR